jgi:hypothetical protein
MGFPYTPQPASWRNPIEIGRSILRRQRLRRGPFTAREDLQAKGLACIDDDHRPMAQPCRWTSTGQPLTA